MKNRLQFEKSPYLLQHQNNPVDWYPWGEEAFKKAENENKPIFLSIGYSTCHWCHVMERESFEDEEVAQVLNEDFICIKVDREERPDIDGIYMNVCQMITGDGGWPLSIFMNYEKKPFFAGTYFPKYNMYGKIGLISLLQKINDLWENDNNKLLDISNNIIKTLNETTKNSKNISSNVINRAYEYLKYSSDKTYGGFSYAPKFPMPHNLMFLLRYWYINEDPHAKDMVEKTLDSMHNGGIYDHIGFGFSRYSTDSKWLVPHFEKMLYDNALLAIAYLEYYQICKKGKYAQIANDIFTFIKREMTDKKGAFYSAQDADSEGIEGKYYVWEIDEIIKVLGEDEGKEFCDYYNITKQGNFEEKNIPNLIGKSEDNMFREHIQKLYNYRNERVHPFKDDKILTSWNGLMIAALAIGGRILKNSEYIDMAKKAAYFILNNMITEKGEIYAMHREGVSKNLGFADDYAFFIWGLLEMYEATFEEEFLEKANSLNNKFIDDFWDEENGGFFLYSKNSEQLITRPKEIYDGAIPSANSVSILNLIRLSKLVENSLLEEKANDILKSFAKFIENNPGTCTFCLANMLYKDNNKNVVLVGAELSDMINKIQEDFNPFTTTLIYTNKIKEMFSNMSEYKILNNLATAYVCEKFKCNPPSNNI